MTEHTPGPWRIEDVHGYNPETKLDLLNRGIFSEDRPDGSRRAVAIITGVGTESDARLIAAAPDLLEAAKRAVVRLAGAYDAFATGEGLWSIENRQTVDALRSAIAKAEGGHLHSAAE